jgi:preprotein translocase subunit SecE
MAMNREQRRLLQRQGQIDAEGNPVATARESRPATAPRERVTPRQYASEVRSEMRRVSWPTRNEVINYSIVVLATLIFATGLIAALDYGFGELVIQLLRVGS